MKILEKDGEYRKVSNDWIADNLVKTMGWKFSSRAEWKANVRDVKKQPISDTKEIVRKTRSVVSDPLPISEKREKRKNKNK